MPTGLRRPSLSQPPRRPDVSARSLIVAGRRFDTSTIFDILRNVDMRSAKMLRLFKTRDRALAAHGWRQA
jgi:hypothetical protein